MKAAIQAMAQLQAFKRMGNWLIRWVSYRQYTVSLLLYASRFGTLETDVVTTLI